MNILWFTWKDIQHPRSGGAEVVNHEIAKRLVADGHNVTMVVSRPKHQSAEDEIDGYKVVRTGNRVTLYLNAAWVYFRRFKGWANLTIEEVNTMPFFTGAYVRGRRVLIVYQLAREVWFHQMMTPFSYIGYYSEYVYMWLLRKNRVITISKSSKQDLLHQGFRDKQVSIMRVGTEIDQPKKLPEKSHSTTVISFGTIRAMKQTLDQVVAFEYARAELPGLKLVIAGLPEGSYGRRVEEYINHSKYKNDISLKGRVSDEQRQKIMQDGGIIVVTSIKEGWGLIVTEAAKLGTPAIVYDRDGLRDSAFRGKGSWVVDPNPEALGHQIVSVLKNPNEYQNMRERAFRLAKNITFENCYEDFKKISKII